MGWDAWTRTPAERASRQRERQHGKKTADSESLVDRLKRRAEGQHKCSQNCGKPGTTFRDRRWLCRGCASVHKRAGGAVDRTPPMSRQRKREIRKGGRDDEAHQ